MIQLSLKEEDSMEDLKKALRTYFVSTLPAKVLGDPAFNLDIEIEELLVRAKSAVKRAKWMYAREPKWNWVFDQDSKTWEYQDVVYPEDPNDEENVYVEEYKIHYDDESKKWIGTDSVHANNPEDDFEITDEFNSVNEAKNYYEYYRFDDSPHQYNF